MQGGASEIRHARLTTQNKVLSFGLLPGRLPRQHTNDTTTPLCLGVSSPPQPIDAVFSTSDTGTSTSETSSASADDVATIVTAFERKAAMLQQFDEASETLANDASGSSEELSGYRFVAVTAIKALIEPLLCPVCLEQLLQLRESGSGANLQFVVCGGRGDIAKAPHSPVVGSSRQPELPFRLAAVSRNCGINFTKLMNLFGGMDTPQPMHLKTFQALSDKVRRTAMDAAQDVMHKSAHATRKRKAAITSLTAMR